YFFSSRRRHTRSKRDWSSDVCSSDLEEHGYDLALSHDQMRQLTATGFWPLYRFDPRRADEGKLPLALDSRPPSVALEETLLHERSEERRVGQEGRCGGSPGPGHRGGM